MTEAITELTDTSMYTVGVHLVGDGYLTDAMSKVDKGADRSSAVRGLPSRAYVHVQ